MTGPRQRTAAGAIAWRTVRAVVLMTGANLRRLLREALILRSLMWPGLVCSVTLAGTLIALGIVRPGREVAVLPSTDPALVTALEEHGFRTRPADDPLVAVHRSGLATDGHTVWALGTSPALMDVEAALRERLRAPWRPVASEPPAPSEAPASGDTICRSLAVLFVLYGLVFGLGGVARDRDAGILEIEQALPIPRWAGGVTRWFSSTVVLSFFFGITVVLFMAIVPVRQPLSVMTHGTAAFSAAVAIGIGVVGSAGLRQGFSGPFALGMTLTTALASAGVSLGLDWLPIASLFSTRPGWLSLLASGGIGLVAMLVYGRRA